jgi:hypothetical protein
MTARGKRLEVEFTTGKLDNSCLGRQGVDVDVVNACAARSVRGDARTMLEKHARPVSLVEKMPYVPFHIFEADAGSWREIGFGQHMLLRNEQDVTLNLCSEARDHRYPVTVEQGPIVPLPLVGRLAEDTAEQTVVDGAHLVRAHPTVWRRPSGKAVPGQGRMWGARGSSPVILDPKVSAAR